MELTYEQLAMFLELVYYDNEDLQRNDAIDELIDYLKDTTGNLKICE